MLTLLLVVGVTTGAMLLLVLFSTFLFRENRTREVREPRVHPRQAERKGADPDAVVWRTLVDPTSSDTRTARPYAAAYSRVLNDVTPTDKAA